jgi:DNA polymerase-3 subunit epsilon
MKNLQLIKPLAFLDLETTGNNIAKDRIVEIAIIKLHPDGKRETYEKKINPELTIPLEISEIHGIYDIDVIDAPKFQEISKEIKEFLYNCDLAGYNSNRFDIPLLDEEFARCDIDINIEDRKLIDVQNIFHKMEQRNLVAALKFYCNKDLKDAHSAMADTLATLDVLNAQIDKYDELYDNVDFLSAFSSFQTKTYDLAQRIAINKDNEYIINFGKHKGKKVIEIFKKEPSYYSWIMSGDFTRNTKKCFKTLWETANKKT